MGTQRKLFQFLLAAGAILTIFLALRIFRPKEELPTSDPHLYESKSAHVELNKTQLSEMVPASKEMLPVMRYQDSKGIWQVSVSSAPPKDATQVKQIGFLYTAAVSHDVDVPVYVCSYKTVKGQSQSLDSSKDCTGGGTLAVNSPVGYVSKLIRTGFMTLVRCQDLDNGMYLSLNTRCENPKHFTQAMLGSIRLEIN